METYLNKIDTAKVNKLLEETGINVTYFNNACADVVKKYSEALDGLMKDLYIDCIKSNDAPMEKIESYYLELSNMIYFMMDKVEELGVYADMSSSASKEIYSKSYLANSVIKDEKGKSKSTVSELTAQASLDSQYETVVASIYDHAYKIVKNKVEAAKDMCSCLKRILVARTNELQFSAFNKGQ